MSQKKWMRKKSTSLAVVWLFLLSLVAMGAPFLLSHASEAMNFSHALEAPSFSHLFGTDSLGRDLFARVLRGSSVSLGVSAGAVLVALFIGMWFGAIAGYYGGLCDRLMMSLVDMMLCFPFFFLVLAVIALLGPSVLNIMWIIGITGWMGTARLVRAEVLSLKEREFMMAARALGASDFRIIARHLVPNAIGPVIVNGILAVSSAILTETGLSFLGVGVQPPTPSWGNILTEAKTTMGIAWWILLFPGLMIFLTVLAVNTVGEFLAET